MTSQFKSSLEFLAFLSLFQCLLHLYEDVIEALARQALVNARYFLRFLDQF